MEDDKIIEEILDILSKNCKNKMHKIAVLCKVMTCCQTRLLVSQTKGTRISY